MWVLDHLADIESDFAVLHRVDDPLSLPGPEFFRKALRLPAYRGVMRARVERAQHDKAPAGSERRREVPLAAVTALHPDLIERRRHGSRLQNGRRVR
jgi:hypothetical protein